jgi:hypothetical protein
MNKISTFHNLNKKVNLIKMKSQKMLDPIPDQMEARHQMMILKQQAKVERMLKMN